ncbi:centromere protein H (CENP-H)-domain-containing protein [Boeremia exigua]|uniref:centromere protein H (CENP-H)-domain-containing protein n=1 Tax=Boeremia exigua TaxID=749465 RepID=UPI001E8E526E|nr:centromere protein H (CENP-H)-domain-containing protein [Boeremia exigua]KAH6616308.1 centromere protein H (CENP-H)-domain-containing protein [Boeremia exigua]
MADAVDTVMTDAAARSQNSSDISDLLQTNHSDAFAFTESEGLALELYDQLRELELQQSLLQAQDPARVDNVSSLSDDDLQEQLMVAEREAMEAKAEYDLRNKITHNILVTDPVLKAVHGNGETGFAEKRLLPLLKESDTIAMVHGRLATDLANSSRVLIAAEQANIVANQRNRELSATMLALAEAMKLQSADDIDDPKLREQIRAVEKELKDSRKRMKTLKGIISAMIVGSGINWAADERLTELVMEDEDD